jgi:SnoaL-like domain
VGAWSRQELQEAHDRYVAVANDCAQRGDWRAWADLFTDDARYIEHHYGEFVGREQIFEWITATMGEWPNSEMRTFPHDWCICDEERGWWVCQIENRFDDPGDGGVYQESNVTILKYAGDGRFSSEEDVYNPARFGAVVKAWMAARR